jgi:hypothetical protein
MADKFGRKKFAMLYCALYIGSCCTKHFNNYWVRLLSVFCCLLSRVCCNTVLCSTVLHSVTTV